MEPARTPGGGGMLSGDHIQLPRLRRTHMVWCALAGAMATVGGFLGATSGGDGAAASSGSPVPLFSARGAVSLDTVLVTPVVPERWQAIVIHHSGSEFDTAETVERRQREVSPSLRGLGYHFLIGNGVRMDEGELFLGYRWLDQLDGAHVAGAEADWFNRNAIGICLIGDGNRREFGDQQVRRLVDLVDLLMRTYSIPPERIYMHSDLVGVRSPGAMFPEAEFRSQLEWTSR